jgi:magnesium-transporting ATPase (P-type)
MAVVKGLFADTVCSDTVNRVPVMISKNALHVILEGIACCSTARVAVSDDDRPQIIGNKTEAALLLLAQSAWSYRDDTDVRRASANFGKPGGSRLFPFSSARKCMSVLVHKEAETGWTLYHKGAAEVVLAKCTTYLNIDGTEKKMTAQKRREFEALIKEFASQALRCVALAHRRKIEGIVDPSTCTVEDCERRLENNLCFDALAGIMDPLREDVIDAVATCQRAGIFVRMVTGDNLDTAEAIARQAGILTEGMFATVFCCSLP